MKRIIIGLAGLSLAVLIAAGWLLSSCFPAVVKSFQEVRSSYSASDGVLLDRNGSPIQELRVDFQGRSLEWTSLKDVSPPLLKAVVASEDKRFFSHRGIDAIALACGRSQEQPRCRAKGGEHHHHAGSLLHRQDGPA